MTFREFLSKYLGILLAGMLFLYTASSSVFVLTFRMQHIHLYIGNVILIGVALYMLVRWKLILLRGVLVHVLFFSVLFAMISALLNPELTEGYRYSAVMGVYIMIPLYFMAAFVSCSMEEGRKAGDAVALAFRLIVLVQAVWIVLQYVLYHLKGIDLNQLVFKDILHREINVSFIRSGVYYPSGFTWHSALLAPLLVIGVLMFKNTLIRLWFLVCAAICGNTTALIGVVMALGLLFLSALIRGELRPSVLKETIRKTPRWRIVMTIVLLAAFIAGAAWSGILSSVWDRVLYAVGRFSKGGQGDGSTRAHLSYFTSYFEIVGKTPWYRTVFGWGEGCSGFLFEKYYDVHFNGSTFIIECDIVDYLLSRGVVGFLAQYGFMALLAVKGAKTDRRHWILVLCLFVMAFGYNIHWNYLFFFELMIYAALQNGLNFFETGAFRFRERGER